MTPPLSDAQINEQVAKALGWKKAEDKWWDKEGASIWKLPNYVGDVGAAWEVVEYITETLLKKEFELSHSRTSGYWFVTMSDAGFNNRIHVGDESAPKAICLSFLKLRQGERSEQDSREAR